MPITRYLNRLMKLPIRGASITSSPLRFQSNWNHPPMKVHSALKNPAKDETIPQTFTSGAASQATALVSDSEDVVKLKSATTKSASPKTQENWKAVATHALSSENKSQEKAKEIPVESLVCPYTLRLDREDGATTVIPAHNYYLRRDGTARPFVKRLAQEALTRSPSTQEINNASITEDYGRYEMSFRVKNHDTGMYDKICNVPVNGLIAPIKESQYHKFVKSTEPVMRALRDLLQKIYSVDEITATSLGLESLPKEDQDKIVTTVKESIYFEPSVVGPQMKDYPFLAVAGFDAAVGNLEKCDPVFFEFNLGTPSGMSNNAQLMQLLAEKDPKLFNTIRHNLPKDDTFQILRSAIESNAEVWTGRKDGISVVVSPGVYNGAHPDVASISMFTGMPLVRPQDLYQDSEGAIRLNTGKLDENPVVTGIYGRAEESFFLQSHEDGIFMKSPAFTDNAQLCQDLGVDLQPGVLYQFQYDSEGEIIGVDKDKDGNPIAQRAFDTIGQDPTRPTANAGSFLDAIKGKKLYYSALGGRTVDDKRVFQAVSEFLAPSYLKGSDSQDPASNIARPPRTLRRNEYDKFYSDPHLENYVVKAPDRSGGDGIYLLVNLTDAERKDVVKQVKANPDHFIVQEFAEFALMTTPEMDPDGKNTVFGTQANDWRLFIIMDGHGNVGAGPNSLLLRTASTGSASTNTSQGGGYGIGVVISETTRIRPLSEKSVPVPAQTPYVGFERKKMVIEFLQKFNQLTTQSNPASCTLIPRNGSLSHFAHQQREVMDILGRDTNGLMSVARDYDNGVISPQELHKELLAYRALLYNHALRPVSGLDRDIEKILGQYTPMVSAEKNSATRPVVLSRSDLMALVSIKSLASGPIKVRETCHHDTCTELFETGVYTASKDPTIQALINEADKLGGQIRMIKNRQSEATEVSTSFTNPYFRVTDDGSPIIGIDLTQEFSLTSLAHEIEHLRMWSEIKENLKLKNAFFSERDASLEAKGISQQSKMRVVGERRSLEAELLVENDFTSPFNRGVHPRAQQITDDGYVGRMVYPENEGVRDLLHKAKWGGEDLNTTDVKNLLTTSIAFALANRKAVHSEYLQMARKLEAVGTVQSSLEAKRYQFLAHHVAEISAFSEMFKYDLDRFDEDGTKATLFTLFKEAFMGMDKADFTINPQDEERVIQQLQEQQ